jgi:sialic acid synthase SpsE
VTWFERSQKCSRHMPSNGPKPGRTITRSKWPSFVAEVSSNHHRDLERCLKFIRTAAGIGCDAVKFQLFRVRELFAPEALRHDPRLPAREAWELPVQFLPDLARGCHEAGILFSCTPFYLEAVGELLPFVDFYKIASYELMWDHLLKACAGTGKPVVLSTGMATLPEVDHACSVLRGAGCQDLTLLHCVSAYPTKPEDCNLAAIATLQDVCQCPVGWSDHSVEPGVISRAVHHWGASMIEFHLDLEGQGAEFSSGHCWLPEAMHEVIRSVRAGLWADGDGEVGPAASELEERKWRADPSDGLRPLLSTRKHLGSQ